MNVLIADDEFYARKALAQIIQDWDGSLTIFEAQNGKEALTILETASVDLIFTDICMPALDGLQLSALISVNHPQATNVIVSGFDDFKYAQEAIVYNVHKYLLKPVEKHEVYQILEQERAKAASRSAQRISGHIRSLLHGERDDERFSEHEWASIHAYATIVMQTAANGRFTLLSHIVSEVFSGHEFVYYHLEDKRIPHMSIVLLIAPDRLAAEKLWVAGGLVRKIARKYTEETGDRLTAGISRIHQQRADLPESYREAKGAMLCRMLHPDDVFESEAASLKSRTHPNLADELLHPLYQKIASNQIAETAVIIESVFRHMAEAKLSVRTLNDISYKLTSILNSAIESLQEAGNRMPYLEPVDLFRFHSLEQLIDYFQNALFEIGKSVGIAHPKPDKIDELKAYIEQHYQENVKLEEIARSLYYADTSYLSKQFKRRYGISFSQYLISVRLKHARQMVMEYGHSMSISDIAGAAGFNDYSYFIQMYKKHYGETPGKHKKEQHE